LRTDVNIANRIVLELGGQKIIAETGRGKTLSDAPNLFNPGPHEFDILIMRCQNVLAAGVASVYHDLLWRLTKPALDLCDCGILPHLAKWALVIDSSTIDMTSARRAHQLASEQGCLSLDAPVSGGVSGASAGTLTFMVGGAKEAFSRGEQIFKHMGTRIVHCGDAGTGQAAKICNNMILGISMAAVCEAFVLAEKLGLSHQALFDVASTSSGQCWSISTNCPVPGPVPTSPPTIALSRGSPQR
jgi:NAD binding domain of 6-phosphogluconate dehydrogenase/NAD-binding of NADP-dependent 3-hydroxyisobutyrate dehydrogenase